MFSPDLDHQQWTKRPDWILDGSWTPRRKRGAHEGSGWPERVYTPEAGSRSIRVNPLVFHRTALDRLAMAWPAVDCLFRLFDSHATAPEGAPENRPVMTYIGFKRPSPWIEQPLHQHHPFRVVLGW